MVFKASILFIGILLLNITFIFSQEHRLNKKKVPTNIQQYIATNYPVAKQVKYYHAIENDSLFIECDLRSGIDKYSLLFLPDGSLYETEVFVTFKEFPTEIETKIRVDLGARFKKYKILDCYEVNPTTNALYEINVKGVTEKKEGNYELFFDKQGNFIKIKENIITPISTVF